MSGGALDYAYMRIENLAEKLEDSNDPAVLAFTAHLNQVAKAAKAIEWWWSGDSSRDDAITEIMRVVSADEVFQTWLKRSIEVLRQSLASLEALSEAKGSGG